MAEYSSTTVAADKEVAVISDSEGEDDENIILEICDGSPHITLPPEVWANIINYLPYDSLISCASTSRAMLYDALPLVNTLFIDKSCQLYVGIVSNHLRDVREVSIYNLFDVNRRRATIQIDEDYATKSVHFLSRLPQLESVAFWGRDWKNLCSMIPCQINNAYGIDLLLDSFSGAFDCRSLPNNLQIIGLRCPRGFFNTSNRTCNVCKRMCKMFPLERIGDIDLCLPFETSNEIIMSRKGGKDYLRSENRFLQLLGKGRMDWNSPDDYCLIKYDSKVRDELEGMVTTSQFDIKKLNSEDMVKAIKKQYRNHTNLYLGEQSFDFLKSIVVPISVNLLDLNAIRVENLDYMVRSVMGETDSFFSPVIGLKKINSLIKKQDPTIIQRVMESGILPKLIEFLQGEEYELQLTSAGILTNIASWGREYAREIAKFGAIPPLVSLLGSSHSEILYSAAWVLGNIARESCCNRDSVLHAGTMQPLLKLLEDHQTSDMESIRIYSWVLCNLCRSMDAAKRPDFKLVSPSLQILNELIYYQDDEVVWYACWALSHLVRAPDEHIQAVIDVLGKTGVCRLVELSEYPHLDVQIYSLRTLGYIAKGNDYQRQIIIDSNALPCLLKLLSSTNESILDDVCWVISNITAGTVEQIQAVIDSGVLPKLIPMLSDGSLLQQIVSEEVSSPSLNTLRSIRIEAGWVVLNATQNGSAKQVKYLVTQGCIPLLHDLLKDLSTERVTAAKIQGALHLLEAHEGKDEGE